MAGELGVLLISATFTFVGWLLIVVPLFLIAARLKRLLDVTEGRNG